MPDREEREVVAERGMLNVRVASGRGEVSRRCRENPGGMRRRTVINRSFSSRVPTRNFHHVAFLALDNVMDKCNARIFT